MANDRFTDEFLAHVQDASDLVSAIDERVPLKKAGKDYVACCPFHSEKTPSFTVSPTKQFYHCFGCGAHGNIFGWLMEYEGLGFVEAVQKQARMVGIALPARQDQSEDEKRRQQYAERLLLILTAANDRFQQQLRGNSPAIDYLKSRGLTGETAKRFEVGYAESTGISNVVAGATTRELLDAGLIAVHEEDGELRDRFRQRVIFPIHNERGAVIGFGGRTMREGVKPKYLNSPEGPVFDKGAELYGLYHAKQAIRQDRTAVVLEGYMDVIMLHQHGEARAVAALGTSLTERQVQKLFRVADQIVFCFDGDAAGQKAAARAVRLVLPELADGKTVKFLMLPPEHDPDSFVREHGIEAWRRLLEQRAEPLSSMILRVVQGDRNLSIPEEKAAVLQELEPLLAEIIHAPRFRVALQSHIESLFGMRLRVRYQAPAKRAAVNSAAPAAAPDAAERVQPLSGKAGFYDNLATLCGLDVEEAAKIPAPQIDDFAALIVSWFSIAPPAGRERLEAATRVKSIPLRKVLTAAVDRVEQKRLLFTPEALEREVHGLAEAIRRVAEQESRKASAGRLFE